jgi:hypothetical protein
MRPHRNQEGLALVAACLLLALALVTALTGAFARSATGPRRAAVTDLALAQAREGLIAFATARPIDAVTGPGYLPCPDTDDDGWAEPTCGSLAGDTGQWQRLGRLPWKTLGLPDLRDAWGERLWYAVSTRHKGLLNCTVSEACLDMGPDTALGTITVRDAGGHVLHDGTLATAHDAGRGGAAAVVISPGPPLARWAGGGETPVIQSRTCEGGRCNGSGRCLTEPPTATPKCDPRNYLDRAPGPAYTDEDNARFVDRADLAGRALNRDGFVQGPVVDRDGHAWVNDRLVAIGYDDLMPRVMRRVGEEVSRCLAAYARDPRHAGRLPWAAPSCRAADRQADRRQADETGVRFGRVPDTPFLATVDSSGTTMSPWWSEAADCRIADARGFTAGLEGPSWWNAWKRHVFVAAAPAADPSTGPAPSCDRARCLVDVDDGTGGRPRRFVVLVSGPPLAHPEARQSRAPGAETDPRHWLENANALLAGLNPDPEAPGCERSPIPRLPDAGHARYRTARGPDANDLVVAAPAEPGP